MGYKFPLPSRWTVHAESCGTVTPFPTPVMKPEEVLAYS
jgi:hypothetical protein